MAAAGEAWADATAEAEKLEEAKKWLLATLTVEQMDVNGNSKAAAETRALASPQYRQHVERLCAARHDANAKRVRFEALKLQLQLARTYEATRRAEMQIL